MKREHQKRIIALCALILPLLMTAGSADAASGSVVGTVRGPGGVALPGATVTATAGPGPSAVSVVTGDGGEFRIAGLVPGSYTIEAQLTGFHTTSANEIQVAEGGVARVQLELPPSTFHDAMEVKSTSSPQSLEAAVLRESGARDVGEALSRMPGVWKVRKGGIANDIVVKGYSQDDVTVLIDGARVAGACPNRMDPPAFHLDFAELDRVELAPAGGNMAAQGSMGGLINVVTKIPGSGLHADVSVAAGSWSMFNPSATVSYGTDRFAVLGGFSNRTSKAYADGSGQLITEQSNYTEAANDADAYDVTSAWTRLYWQPAEKHELNLSYAHQAADDVLYPALLMDALVDDTDRLVLGYRYSPERGSLRDLRATAYATQVEHWMVDSLRTSAGSAPRGWSMGTMATTRIIGASADADVGPVTLGFETYSRNWDAWTEMAGMNYMRQYTIPDGEIDVAGLSARWLYEASQRTRLQIGGRVDWVATSADPEKANTGLYYAYHGTVSTSRTDVEPSLSVQLVHEFNTRVSLTGGLSRSVRSPDPRERYIALKRKVGDWVGNPELDPPAANRAELGLTWSAGVGTLTATAWADSVDGYIIVYNQEKINMAPGVMNNRAQSYANVDALLRGAAVEGSIALSSRVFLSGDVAYVRGTQDPIPELGIYSEDIAEMPPLSVRLAARWQSPKLFAEIEGVGAAGQDKVDVDLNESTTPSWGIVNLKGGITTGPWRIQVVLGNIFDRTYHEHYSYLRNPYRSGFIITEPGRNVTFSIGWRK
jgi:iron complex outermembrane receptor protein